MPESFHSWKILLDTVSFPGHPDYLFLSSHASFLEIVPVCRQLIPTGSKFKLVGFDGKYLRKQSQMGKQVELQAKRKWNQANLEILQLRRLEANIKATMYIRPPR